MVRHSIYAFFWFGLMWATLQVQKIELGHLFCGAWGCGPPAESLLGIHLFWLAALVPPILFLAQSLPLPWQMGGKLLVCVAIISLIGIGIFDYLGENRYYYHRGYVWQRYVLSVGSMVDFPVFQLLFTGALLMKFGRQCPCCSRNVGAQQETEIEPNQLVPTGSE